MKNKLIALFALGTIIFSCANKGNISGGLKDEEPPVLFHVEPLLGSTNIKPKEIKFQFDENIKLKDVRKNLLISPVLMKGKPIIKEYNKGFTLTLPDSIKLEENTTYSFNFGNAVTDLNEGNELAGFKYVFSTGDEIDKGKLSGLVLNTSGEQLEEKENTWAVLYKNLADSSVTTLTPDYITAIDEKGSFNFDYLANGEYKLYIVKDNNANYYYDLPNEKIAFTTNTISIKDTSIVELTEPYVLFQGKETSNYVKVVDNKNNTFSIVGKQPIESYVITDSLNQYKSYIKEIHTKDSITVYLNENSTFNKLYIQNPAEEIDTFSIREFKASRVDSLLKAKVLNDNYDKRKPLELQFNQPVTINYNEDKIKVLEDSLFIAGGVELKTVENKPKNVLIYYNWEQAKEYDITLYDGLFKSIYEPVNDTIKIIYEIPNEDQFSTIKAQLPKNRPAHNIIVSLFKGEEELQTDILPRETNEIVYTNLYPGEYQFKVVLDQNNDGVWNTGNFEQKIQPEKIIWYKEDIKAMRNWEVEVELDF